MLEVLELGAALKELLSAQLLAASCSQLVLPPLIPQL